MFWEIAMICPKCQEEAKLVKCLYSAKGEFVFHAFCKTCQHIIAWEVLAEALKYMAYSSDKRSEKMKEKVEENPPQKPILQKKELPYLQERLSAEDILQMKKWNIKS